MEQRWEAGMYDQAMSFVSKYGEDILDLIAVQPGERIIDWGCGTGDLAAQLSKKGAIATGIDASESMIAQAQHKYPDITFLVADGQRYRPDTPVDAVMSNAALHWMTDAESTAASIAGSLRAGGRFAAEFGAAGNIQEVRRALQESFDRAGVLELLKFPWYFPSIGEYTPLLERHGLSVRMAVRMERPTPLTGGEQGLRIWLETFANGLLMPLNEAKRREVIGETERRLKQTKLYRNGEWVLDYERIRITATKR
ncbi:methyltransferase domain-containing protein [Paenibacillus spongiae]|uniref:Methyltransferase domain-containing protein n=1 Tax=Paenibacillus spongiae TaxID=2909671 RepID=A0ABY5SDU3_9BACL|nr:methyltransferase domain-containing protein [Paenibacillus spongiae]UVI31814.1 methyltransferase domain-containing protein [Paenibacillus spongiae]